MLDSGIVVELPDNSVRFIWEIHVKPTKPLVIAPDYQIVSCNTTVYIIIATIPIAQQRMHINTNYV